VAVWQAEPSIWWQHSFDRFLTRPRQHVESFVVCVVAIVVVVVVVGIVFMSHPVALLALCMPQIMFPFATCLLPASLSVFAAFLTTTRYMRSMLQVARRRLLTFH